MCTYVSLRIEEINMFTNYSYSNNLSCSTTTSTTVVDSIWDFGVIWVLIISSNLNKPCLVGMWMYIVQWLINYPLNKSLCTRSGVQNAQIFIGLTLHRDFGNLKVIVIIMYSKEMFHTNKKIVSIKLIIVPFFWVLLF